MNIGDKAAHFFGVTTDHARNVMDKQFSIEGQIAFASPFLQLASVAKDQLGGVKSTSVLNKHVNEQWQEFKHYAMKHRDSPALVNQRAQDLIMGHTKDGTKVNEVMRKLSKAANKAFLAQHKMSLWEPPKKNDNASLVNKIILTHDKEMLAGFKERRPVKKDPSGSMYTKERLAEEHQYYAHYADKPFFASDFAKPIADTTDTVSGWFKDNFGQIYSDVIVGGEAALAIAAIIAVGYVYGQFK